MDQLGTTCQRLSAAIVCGLLLPSMVGCDRPGDTAPTQSTSKTRGTRHNLLLISMDTTRADRLGCYGCGAIRTPHIDSLASEGVLFEQCYSAGPVTLPSHATILTGTYPFVHGVRDNGVFQLHADNRTLAEALKDAGYKTAASVGAFVLDREFGIAQGFDDFRDMRSVAERQPMRGPTHEIGAEEVTDAALELLSSMGDAPWFLFTHYFDPHRPLTPPERFKSLYDDTYLAEIAYVDEQIGRLLEAVRASGAADRTLVVLTADHGEGLGAHGENTHGSFIYDTTLHVPLIMRMAGVLPAGRRVREQVRTVDIASTILNVLELPSLPLAQGTSLLPWIREEDSLPPLASYSETFMPTFEMGFSPLLALRSEGWKYIYGPRPELYQVSADPDELTDLVSENADRAAALREQLRALLEGAPPMVGDAQRSLAAGDVKRLQALGYLAGTPTGLAADAATMRWFEPSAPNPMDHALEITIKNRVVALVQNERHAHVEAALRALIKEAGPRADGFAWVHSNLASALAGQGRFAEALRHYELSLRANPRDGRTLTMMGFAQLSLGLVDEAVESYRRALDVEPVLPTTYGNLGLALAHSGKFREALVHMKRAMQLDPLLRRDATALGNLAGVLNAVGKKAKALATLEEAIRAADSAGQVELSERLDSQRQMLTTDKP